ncbi:MAG: helix-turn-helix transcriptional regulator [Clostridia bacterium]|nr:helix-turn-helix transcriptional regulator [Clostridia bacterium]MBR2943993.1 helix-turn-helix transcriptional regulator [Clostridia bacterium]
MNIGEKIRNAREDLDLSQEEIARQIPMSQSGYSKIERNVQEPSLMQLRRICQILNISADFLLALNFFNSLSENDLTLLYEIKSAIKKYSDKQEENN